MHDLELFCFNLDEGRKFECPKRKNRKKHAVRLWEYGSKLREFHLQVYGYNK